MRKKKVIKKKSRKALVKELDRVHSLFIRKVGGNICVVCGKKENPTCGHLLTRTSYSTRWDTAPDGNCHVQCKGCNYNHESRPQKFTMWYINRFGYDKYVLLCQRHSKIEKFKDFQLQEKIEGISLMLADLETNSDTDYGL